MLAALLEEVVEEVVDHHYWVDLHHLIYHDLCYGWQNEEEEGPYETSIDLSFHTLVHLFEVEKRTEKVLIQGWEVLGRT